MAQLPVPYDPSQHKPSEPREAVLIPRAWYAAAIESSEVKVTKVDLPPEQQGRMLSLKFRVAEGPRAGAVFYEGLNIVNRNPKAVEIANRDLAAICAAVGFAGVCTDSEVLHGIILDVLVDVEAPSKGFGPKNRAKGYKPAAESRSCATENLALQAADPPKFDTPGVGAAPGAAPGSQAANMAPPAAAGGSGAVAIPPAAAGAVAAPPAAAAAAAAPATAASQPTMPAPATGDPAPWAAPAAPPA